MVRDAVDDPPMFGPDRTASRTARAGWASTSDVPGTRARPSLARRRTRAGRPRRRGLRLQLTGQDGSAPAGGPVHTGYGCPIRMMLGQLITVPSPWAAGRRPRSRSGSGSAPGTAAAPDTSGRRSTRALGHRRHPHLPGVEGDLRRRARPGHGQPRAGRRDQPGAGQGAVGAARGDGRAAGVDRRRGRIRCRSRSWCWPPRTRSRARASTSCPRRSATGS